MMMKFKFSLLILIVILISVPCYAKDFSISLSGGIGYDRGVWESGRAISLTGKMSQSSMTWGAAIQVIYDKWEWQPTLEISYRHSEYDFSNWQAHIQEAKPDIFSGRIGLTKDFQNFSAYGLFGMTRIYHNARLFETIPLLNHGSHDCQDNVFSMKFGIYRLWRDGIFKLGPELSLEIFPERPGFERCRNFHTNRFVPFLWLRSQW